MDGKTEEDGFFSFWSIFALKPFASEEEILIFLRGFLSFSRQRYCNLGILARSCLSTIAINGLSLGSDVHWLMMEKRS